MFSESDPKGDRSWEAGELVSGEEVLEEREEESEDPSLRTGQKCDKPGQKKLSAYNLKEGYRCQTCDCRCQEDLKWKCDCPQGEKLEECDLIKGKSCKVKKIEIPYFF